VVLLRDVEGLSSAEVQATTGFEPPAQRMLLHQGRAAIWQALGPEGGAT
jgi:DNA-directed RNA polymerase specialized sigma24 family protein